MTGTEVAQRKQETVFSFSRVGNAAVVTLACPAVREWQASVLASYLSDVVERNRGRAVIVDVGGVAQFSCAWINTLITLTDRALSMGGQLWVVGLSRDARRMMRSTGLLRRLRMAVTTGEALAEVGEGTVSPWRMAVARMLAIPVLPPPRAKVA